MSLSPNAPAPRPAAPAPRPDLEALLLSAVRQRDHQAAAWLVQQWVHRRSVGSLEHFQLEILAPGEGTEAFDWLCQLIDEGPLAVAAPAALAAPLAVAETSSAAVAIPAPPPGDVEARAIAAVDAAFDALAAEFPQFRLPDPADQFVVVGAPDGATSVNVQLEPSVAPERPIASEQPMTASAQISQTLSPELLSADIDLDEPPAVLEEPPAELFEDPILFPLAASDPLAGRRFSFEIPQAPVESAIAEPPSGPPHHSAPEVTSEDTSEPVAGDGPAALAEAAQQDAPLARLRHRLRRGLSLTRVRTLMRDCLDEAVASLNPPQAEPLDAVMDTGAAEDFACQDEGVATPSPSAAASALASPLVTAIASVEPSAPAPAFAPLALAMAAVQDVAAHDVAAPLSPAAQLRQRLRSRRVDTRPAPAPASLSDLRAWLPSVDDVSRAS